MGVNPSAPPLLFMADSFEIKKVDRFKQYVFGWASVALDVDGVPIIDSHDHEIIPDELEEAVYVFNLASREMDEAHTDEVQGHMIESFIVTPEKLKTMGLEKSDLPTGWWVGFWVPDPNVFAKVVAGDYSMFSIAGSARLERA